jgi:hypothetical protein
VWLFLIGATDDHRALGIFQYVMVALFWALLFASAWVAFKAWRRWRLIHLSQQQALV